MTRARLLVLLASTSVLAPSLACDAEGASRENGPSTVGDDDDNSGPNTTGSVTATTGLTGVSQSTTDATSDGTSATSDPSSDTDEPSTSSGSTSGASTDSSGDTSSGSTSDTGSSDSSEGSTSHSSSSSETTDTPPDPLDLSGFMLTQTMTDASLTLPAGTVLEAGQRLVIGRDATRGAFETHWGVVLGDEVVYLNSAGTFPIINGDEVFSLFDASDALVDGPSPALEEGRTLQRVDLDSTGAAAWESNVFGSADPGTAWPPSTVASGVFITEASDSQGTGAFVYEFVELQVWP